MKHRLLRVNEVLKRELSGIITREMKFEKGLVTINQVDVTADLKSAHVFVSVLGTAGRGRDHSARGASRRLAIRLGKTCGLEIHPPPCFPSR